MIGSRVSGACFFLYISAQPCFLVNLKTNCDNIAKISTTVGVYGSHENHLSKTCVRKDCEVAVSSPSIGY